MSKSTVKDIQIELGWKEALKTEFEADYFSNLKDFLVDEKVNKKVYPTGNLMFNAFNSTPLDQVKVVIIGQDPYHGPGQAHGLCFSVPEGIAIPPSLRNIYKEMASDLNIPIPNHGNLSNWAKQGILLLNATLSVRAHEAGSHQGKGWETFTDSAIKAVSDHGQHIVFLLWGAFAQKKASLIDSNKHFILKSVHPSPLSAHRGFLGCKHFSKTNSYLQENGIQPIDWNP